MTEQDIQRFCEAAAKVAIELQKSIDALQTTQRQIADLLTVKPKQSRVISLETIAVRLESRTAVDVLRHRGNTQSAVTARHLFCAVADYCGYTQSDIARFLDRDRSTVHYALANHGENMRHTHYATIYKLLTNA